MNKIPHHPYEEKFPEGMVSFVDQYYDLLDWADFCEKYKQKDTVPDNDRVFRMWIENINRFLKTRFVYENGVPEYERVEDLPVKQMLLALECLGYRIGINIHTGGYSFAELYKERMQDHLKNKIAKLRAI